MYTFNEGEKKKKLNSLWVLTLPAPNSAYINGMALFCHTQYLKYLSMSYDSV